MNKTLQDDKVGFSIMGLVTGGCFFPLILPLWTLCVYIWKSNKPFEFERITRINDNHPIVFLLPLLVFLGGITGGLLAGSRTLAVTNKRALAICGAALGGVLGTILASLLFIILNVIADRFFENVVCQIRFLENALL